MAVSAVEPRGQFWSIPTPDPGHVASLVEIPPRTSELLILTFTDAAAALTAAHLLGAVQPRERAPLRDALVLSKDASGARTYWAAEDFVRRALTIHVWARRVVMRLLPGPLTVLTGRSTSSAQDILDSTDPLVTPADFESLARCLASDSSALLLLVDQCDMSDVTDRIARIHLTAKAKRLQVTLDGNVERFMVRQE